MLDAFLERIALAPELLLVESDPGMGKTTLWREAVAAGRRRMYWVLRAQPVEVEAKMPFMALADLFEPVLEDALWQLPDPQRDALEVALLRAGPSRRSADPRAVSLAVLKVLRWLSARRPVLVALDDLPWLDAPSARALAFAVRRLELEPVGVFATRRRFAVRPGLDVDSFSRYHRVERLEVSPLLLAELDRLLRGRLGLELPRSILLRVARISGGNPLFALELGRALQQPGVAVRPGEPLPIPVTLRALLRERLDKLPAPTRKALLVASCLADPTVEIVAAALGRHDRALAALTRAAAAHVIEPVGGRIRFTHPLLPAILYSELAEPARHSLHRRVAAVVRDPEERARHLGLAAIAPDSVTADALEQAAQGARVRGAPEAAAELAELARALTPADERRRGRERTMRAAEYHFAAGDAERARLLLEQLASELPPGDSRAHVLRRLGEVLYNLEGFAAARRVFEQALEESGDTAVGAQLERDLAWVAVSSGDIPSAAARAHAVVARADALADDRLRLEGRSMAAIVDFMLGRGVDLAPLERAAAVEEGIDDHPLELRPALIVGMLLKWQDRLEAARTRLEAVRMSVADRGEEASLPFLLFQLAELECWAGNWRQAEAYAEEAERIPLDGAAPTMRVAVLCTRALVAAYLGRSEEAHLAAEAALAGAERSGWVAARAYCLSSLGFLQLSLGDHVAADRLLRPLAALTATAGLAEPAAVRFLPDEIEALVFLGELEQADSFLRPLEEHGRALDRAWALATAGRCRALLQAAGGDLEGALVSVQGALRAHERLPMPFELGRTLLVEGTIARRAKQKRASREALEQAGEIFERLGAPLWAEKARRELQRIGGRGRPAGLTPTEERIAELVAEGKSNREVAEAMFLSVKSIEANLSRIYRTLGVTSRAQLVRKRAAAPPAPID